MDFQEDEEVITRLSDGLVLRDLVNSGSAEFTLETGDVEAEQPDEYRVESNYDFKDYESLINLDMIDLNSSDSGASPFSVLEEKMTNVLADGGVKKLIKESGNGIRVADKAFVYIHYSSYLELQEVPFDSSYLRSDKPIRLQVGVGSVYFGLDCAISSMTEKEKSQFLIKPEYAFGKMGIPPRIPQNATLFLEVHLIKVIDCGAVMEDPATMGPEEKRSFPQLFKKAKGHYSLGNDYYEKKNITSAIENYRKGERILVRCSLENDVEEQDMKHLLMKIYVNLCICYNNAKLNSPEKVCIFARDATRLDPVAAKKNVKLQYNWAKALMFLSDYKKATHHIKLAHNIEPANKEVNNFMSDLMQKIEKYKSFEQITYQKALGLSKSKKENIVQAKDIKTAEVSEEFRKEVSELISEFAKSKKSRLQLPKGFVEEEKQLIRSLCDSLDLTYQEQLVGDEVNITILK